MASVEINLVRDFAVMAMIISSRVLMVKSLPNIGMRNRVRSSFRRLAIQWSLRCSGRLVDAFPMAWDRLEVIGTEYIHVVQEDLNSFGLECGSHVRLEVQVWSFEGPTEGRGMHCSMREQFASSCRKADD